MLPNQLRRIKERLDTKRFADLRREEAELLEELRLVDRRLSDYDMRELRESVTKITSGPGGVCACCGR